MTPKRRKGLDDRRLAHYRALLASADADAVHDLIVRHGAEILDRDLPYLVVAARNQLRSSKRSGPERYDTPMGELPERPTAEGSIWDPLARIAAHEGLLALARSLAELDARDVLVLWSHAAGHSDAEIVAQWDRLGFSPPNPTEVAIRKRRERAGQRLREHLEHGSS
ncbi:MAG TPA: hypothetical protein VHS55_03310 [Solirubrobacteraceae bacterium]|nr:hypothetical protein [Solirubrobacteraceae bacterium]